VVVFLLCIQCGSDRFFKDGFRLLADGTKVQRWLCRNCGYRFSEPKTLNLDDGIGQVSQICAKLEAKNLESAQGSKTCVEKTQHGLVVDFQWKMKKRGLSDVTISNRTTWLNELLRFGADLKNPDSVETVLATEEIKLPTKDNIVKTYAAFTKAFNIPWEKIKVSYTPKEPFDPLEEEIDLLIGACGYITSTFLQTLKDTGARVGELRQLEWTDINNKNGTIAINHPEKGSRTRTLKVTDKTIGMLKNLPKKYGDHVFSPKCISVRRGFTQTRKRMAERMQNPRLLKIHFHTLRHWRASREYEKTGDIYAVKDLLGHKSIVNTDRYQHGTYANNEYLSKRPKTAQEEDDLITAGFEYVRFDEKEQVPIYRRRK